MSKTAYFISIENNDDGIMADTIEEAHIFIGRLIERLHTDDKFNGKYIYITEYLYDEENNKYVPQDNLFRSRYLIEK